MKQLEKFIECYKKAAIRISGPKVQSPGQRSEKVLKISSFCSFLDSSLLLVPKSLPLKTVFTNKLSFINP